MKKEILKIFVSEIGWIERFTQVKREGKRDNETTWIDVDTPILEVVDGITNRVVAYRQANRQGDRYFNERFVVEVDYFENNVKK